MKPNKKAITAVTTAAHGNAFDENCAVTSPKHHITPDEHGTPNKKVIKLDLQHLKHDVHGGSKHGETVSVLPNKTDLKFLLNEELTWHCSILQPLEEGDGN
jgi:hypothetical protein